MKEGTVALHYELEGPENAPVLVLSNSLGTALGMWDEQATVLRNRLRLVRYDHRGHGGSPVVPGPYAIEDLGRDLLTLLDRLGVERLSFCGLSIGGMVGMWLASEAPERVERLVLCCTSALLGPPEAWEERARTVRAEGTSAIAEATMERWFTQALRVQRPEVVRWARGMLEGVPAEGYAGCCEAIRDMDLRDRLARVTAPTLVIAAEDDPATPPEHAEEIHASIPDSSLIVLPGAAHLANVEKSGAVTSAVLDHLDPLRARGTRARREVLGDDYVDASAQKTTPLTAEFQDLVTRYAWGEVWGRPGLDRRTRSCITITALVALGRLDELELHLRGALRNGLSREEIREVLLQCAIYCGVPAANAAFAVARRVLED